MADIDFTLPERIRDEYDAAGKYRMYRGKRRYSSSMYEKMAFEWARDNLHCPECGGSLVPRRWARNGSRELGNVTCEGCGKRVTFVADNLPMLGTVRMSSYLRLIHAIEEKSLPDFVLLSYDKESLAIKHLLYLRGDAVTPAFVRPGWRPVEDDGHDIWCDIEAGRLNALSNGTAMTMIYPAPDETPDETPDEVPDEDGN